MKNLTWQNPEQLFVAQVLINKVKSKCCGIKDNDEATKHIAGLFRLRIYKMPADIVPDPEKRYIEASVFDSGSCYKAEMLVGSGNKEEIIAIMKTEKFRLKLYDTYIRLLDMLRD